MTHSKVQRITVTAETTASGTATVSPSPQRPIVYPATHYGGTLPAPESVVATEMNKITPATQNNNARDLYTFLDIHGNDLRYLNREDALFTSLV